jgi:hypothetical protein
MSEGGREPGGKQRIAPALCLVLILAAAAFPATLCGQARSGGAMGFSPGFAGGARMALGPGSFAGHGHGGSPVHGGVGGIRPQRGIRGGFRRNRHNGDGGFGSAFLGSPFWYDDGWYGYSSVAAPEEEKAADEASRSVVEPALPPAQPLMIERQGDRFVRLSDAEVNAAPAGNNSTSRQAKNRTKSDAQSGSGAADEVPAVLVFRDGHQQDVASYSIIGGTLYESASYYSSGSWTRKIQLADLDIPATIKMNHERGVNFLLPGGPNQVVTRP